MDLITKKCTKCNLTLNINKFSQKRDDSYFKFCDHCRTYVREYRQRTRCLHKKFLYNCQECLILKQTRSNTLRGAPLGHKSTIVI